MMGEHYYEIKAKKLWEKGIYKIFNKFLVEKEI